MECIVSDKYELLEEGALSRVSEGDIKRVLSEYNSEENIVIPPDDYYETIYVGEYADKSGYYVDLDLWYCDGQSDLTLQIVIKKNQNNELQYRIEDLRVL